MKNLVLFRLSCLQSKNITSNWEGGRGGKQRNSKDLGDANTRQEESRKTSEGNRMQDNKETKLETGRQQKEEITRKKVKKRGA